MTKPAARPSTLTAALLGDVLFLFAGTEISPASRKGTALLAYLCLRPEGASREDLAEIFWGPGRLANLRQELYALRHLTGADSWLFEDSAGIRVSADTDVARLGQGEESAKLAHQFGTLLQGFDRLDAPAFQDWLDFERRRVAELLRRSRFEAAEALSLDGRHVEALAVLDAALAVDPLDEHLVRAAMRAAYASDDPDAALRRYDDLLRGARDELGLDPDPETLELAGLIERGERLNRTLDLHQVEGDLKDLLRIAAIADGALDVAGIAKVAERRPLDVAADLARLERSGWLDQHLEMDEQTRQSVLDVTPGVVQRLLNQNVAKALATVKSDQPALVAGHLLASDRATEAAPLLLKAGEVAVGRSALQEASEHLFRALWAGTEVPEIRLAAALLLEGCAGQLGNEELQNAALAEAEALAWQLQTDRGLADVRMRRSRTQLRRGAAGESLESALEALEIATRLQDEQLMARARNAVGGAQYYAGDLDGAEISFTANADVADPVERYRARNNLGSIAGIRGRPHEALRHLEVALTLGRAAGEHAGVVGTLNNVAATAERIGDHRRAIKYFKEGLALAKSSGSTAVQGQLLMNLAVIYSRIGELGPSWNTAVEVEEMAAELGDPRLTMLALEQQAEVLNLCGEKSRAAERLEAAARQAAAIGDERKEAGLTGALLVLQALAAPDQIGSAVAYLEGLSDSHWADVKPWLWLELALGTEDAAAATNWLAKATGVSGDSEHVDMVVDLARLRTGLLVNASTPAVEAAGGAHQRLVAVLEPENGVSYSYVQTPHARLLAGHWYSLTSAVDPQAHAGDVLKRVNDELSEQAAGLPKALRASLAARPKGWLSGLRRERLTDD